MNGVNAFGKEPLNHSWKPMEVSRPLTSNDGLKRHPLTPIRVLRGLICLLVLLSTAFMMLLYCAPAICVILRLFSVHYSRKVAAIFFGAWLALWPFLFEKINKTKVVFSGESVPAKERVLLIANHRTEVDWMYLWDLALRKGRLGHIKYILKSSLMKLPVFGWGFHILEFISVERKWELDESTMRQMLSTFSDPRDPLWLAVFPEGTDFTEQKCIRSQEFAADYGLPILKNVLLPKTKGFYACLENLRNSLDAVYDVTIAYKYRCPLFMDNLCGVDPAEVHIHVRRILLSEIPTSEKEAAAWLMDTFKLKDQLLSDFKAQGCFPNQQKEGNISTFKCLVNFLMVIAFTSMCAFLTFFSSIWFKIYVALGCAYLASATYFNFRPSPVIGSVKAMLGYKQSKL
ncbi:probable 1-acyl-sn-glycerol-3-phosphate acyltransferase 5 [Telopea speciosissima]|uniref:probable 1-acyl-sn-glycerol-3-phosphate acyltransferase 5 n=1 Tax=Telopea speciosissima TaxID=54955 RepID=UPI001CC67726|nr:probable 1-acyl-sn-glycerol-3-phosphate acyltransferase 5 [Telopea speciosissima]XP_043712639.1 probable 1-acyl-sn-glycerol-3-phosphate acyltransferase 5 [Telopea speciosissima]